jgi:hypothetical protein
MAASQLPPSIDPDSIPQVSSDAFMSHEANYDLGAPSAFRANLAQALDNDDDDALALAMLGKAYGG